MSSMESIKNLSKYILSLPDTKFSFLAITIVSFVIGILSFIICDTAHNPIYNILYGGTFGFLVFGVSAIISGAITQPWVNSLGGRRMKMKQSMFLSFFAMTISSIIYLLGCCIYAIFKVDVVLNAFIFTCVLVFAIRMIIIWTTSNINASNSLLISSVQPGLIVSMFVILKFLDIITMNVGYLSVLLLSIKIIIASAIFLFAIYSFVLVVESPLRRNLGIGALELLSMAIAHLTEESPALESVFKEIGVPVSTLVGLISFKARNKKKALFITPCVHPGPIGKIGGSNMPALLSKRFNTFTMVAHGPSTHDFNPVSSKEIYKIEKAIKQEINKIEYSKHASKVFKVSSKDCKIKGQFFGKDLLLLITFSPKGSDDIDFGVGLAAMNLAKAKCNSKNVIIVDCHNSFNETARILPGNKEVFEIMDAIEKIDCNIKKYPIEVGCSSIKPNDISKEEGIGEDGIKTLVTKVNNQKFAYILLDSNNMVKGFREEILKN